MKHINLSFQRLSWKMFPNCTYFPQNPMLWQSASFSCATFFLSFEKQQQKSLSPGSAQCILLCECWSNSILTGHSPSALYSHFQREEKITLNTVIEKISLHIAHFTWWTTSHFRVSLTLRSGESGVFCWTSQFVSSKCFSVKKQQQFLDSCTGKIFYSITLKILFRDIIKHFIFYMWNTK